MIPSVELLAEKKFSSELRIMFPGSISKKLKLLISYLIFIYILFMPVNGMFFRLIGILTKSPGLPEY